MYKGKWFEQEKFLDWLQLYIFSGLKKKHAKKIVRLLSQRAFYFYIAFGDIKGKGHRPLAHKKYWTENKYFGG